MVPKELSRSQTVEWDDVRAEALVRFVLPSIHSFSVRHCVQSERGGVLFGPQTKVFNAGGLIVVAGQATCSRRLQQWAVPHLLGVMGQGLVVGLAGQGAQRCGGHVDIHSQVWK